MHAAERFVHSFYDRYPGRVPLSVAFGMGLTEIFPFVYEDAAGHAVGLAALGMVADAAQAVVQIFHLSTFVTRRGVGSRLLCELCAEADRRAVILTTTPLWLSNGKDTRMADVALRGWYRRHGFEGETLLHRPPVPGPV